jgi:hypothetical protein
MMHNPLLVYTFKSNIYCVEKVLEGRGIWTTEFKDKKEKVKG